jgi:iron complex outermembrane recepter protein
MDDTSAEDPMRRGQVGGRYDWKPGRSADATVQGDVYVGRLGLITFPDTPISGGNVLGRWSLRGAHGATQITTFFDRTERHIQGQFGEVRRTYDADVQQTLAVEDRHSLVFGGGYRASSDATDDESVTLFFEPKDRTTHLFNFFVQDEIRLGRAGWFVTGGTRLEHNSYSGWELQPTGRIRLTKPRGSVWGAVSRAVRMPTRFDSDLRFTGGAPFVLVTGDSGFKPEQLVAYETGVRAQPAGTFSFDVTVYHDEYRHLRSLEQIPGAPITIGNTIQGNIDGIEFGATWELSDILRVHGSTTYVHKSLERAPGSRDITGGEGNDPCCLARAQLFADLRDDLRLTILGRFISALPAPRVPAYGEADVTLQWDVRRGVELSFVGQNLLHDRHPEFTSPGQEIIEAFERSVFVTLTLRR